MAYLNVITRTSTSSKGRRQKGCARNVAQETGAGGLPGSVNCGTTTQRCPAPTLSFIIIFYARFAPPRNPTTQPPRHPSTSPLHLPRGLASAQLLPVGGAENQPIQKNHTSLAQRFFFFFSSLVSSSRFSFYGTRCALVPVCTRSWESHNVEFS